MPTMDDLIKLVQQAEAGKNDVVVKNQAVDAANAAAAAAAQAVGSAVAERDRVAATQAANVEQVLAMVRTLYSEPYAAAN